MVTMLMGDPSQLTEILGSGSSKILGHRLPKITID